MRTFRRSLAIAAVLTAIAAGVTFATGLTGTDEAEAASSSRFTQLFCGSEGTWVGNAAAGDPTGTPLTYSEQFSPVDLRTLNYRIEFKNVNATWAILPDTDTWIGMEGVAKRTDFRDQAYEVSAIGYGIKEVDGDRGQIQHITTMIGKFRVDGCNDKQAETVLRVYDYTQTVEITDADGNAKTVPLVDQDLNGIPDEGAVPAIETPPIPFPSSKRVQLGLPN